MAPQALVLLLWGAASVLMTAALTSSAAVAEGPQMTAEQHHRTSERVIEHHSFSPPLLRDYYGEEEIRHWSIGGTTVITDHYVRLTGDRRGQAGHLWNTEPLDMSSFEIVVGFHIHGKSAGADGFALWITKDKPSHNGPIMGSPMDFTGLGIIFDTYDNDGLRDNPAVYVLFNGEGAGKRLYSPQKDFRGEHVGSCRFAFRQTSPLLSTARIRYERDVLTIYLSHNGEKEETLCTTVTDLHLKADKNEYYIGLSAETGDVTDNHDIVFVHTMPLEGVTYDHDVYARTTPIEEGERHRLTPRAGELREQLQEFLKQQQQRNQQPQQEQQPPQEQQQQQQQPPQQQQPSQQQEQEQEQQQQQQQQPPQEQQQPSQEQQQPPQEQRQPPQQQQQQQQPSQQQQSFATGEERLRELQRELDELKRQQRPARRERYREEDEGYDEEVEEGDDDRNAGDYADDGEADDTRRRAPRRRSKFVRSSRRRRPKN
ncbi:putative lectin [Trypanosoma conorhini]|uniref:Putative lectin n=1 Tax=Trypanosoma conorhini TaxID=83891 RepID=A0A422MPL3_9TRYP|nr:putative lectin [Trypanosoma conorhini]RNE95142.1 putative lectin [Trypanosoma conorhini]